MIFFTNFMYLPPNSIFIGCLNKLKGDLHVMDNNELDANEYYGACMKFFNAAKNEKKIRETVNSISNCHLMVNQFSLYRKYFSVS